MKFCVGRKRFCCVFVVGGCFFGFFSFSRRVMLWFGFEAWFVVRFGVV